MKYTITVARTVVKLRDIEVEAENEDEAAEKALDSAGDYDFNDGEECGVEYEVYGTQSEEEE